MPDLSPARDRFAMLLLAACALSGCSDGGATYPSLASRPAERLTDTAPPAAAPLGPGAASAPSAELAGRLGELLAQARAAKRDFDDRQAGAERWIAAAGAAPAGSEEWARATQVLSGAESARSLTAQPLSDLDRLDVEDRLHDAQLGPADNPARPDTSAIAQARDAISALVAQEDEALARLNGRLAR